MEEALSSQQSALSP